MMIIARGAEAVITEEHGKIVKTRVKKGYRLQEIDEQLRIQRTRWEGKLLEKAGGLAPQVYGVDEKEFTIVMDKIEGPLVRDVIEDMGREEMSSLWTHIGEVVRKLHDLQVIHGDLTTSNMVVSKDGVKLIDFGLGFVSTKEEDKAVDIHLLRQCLEGKHHRVWERCWESFLQGYQRSANGDAVMRRLEKVEKRGRYKRKEGLTFAMAANT